MRSDMRKVIVERPRRGSWKPNEKTARRLSAAETVAAATDPDDFDGGPRRPHFERGKHLNENLAPLRRYLEKQVGRPWDKVYGEVLQGIDTRSAIGLHVLQHVPDFVWIETMLVNGQVVCLRWNGAHPVSGLYVDPRTGLLRDADRKKKRSGAATPAAEPNWVAVSQAEAYQKIDGLWFRVQFREPTPEEVASRGGNWPVFVSKQQCDHKTIRKIERGDLGMPVHRR